MSLLAASCVRCGAPVPGPSGDDLPTCPRCVELVRARLQPETEPSRRCPVDGAAMAKDVVHMLVVDRCPTCSGVWLDGGELELLRRAVAGGDREPLARTVVLGMAGR